MAAREDSGEVILRRGPRSDSERRRLDGQAQVFQEYSDSDEDAESTSGNSTDPEDADIHHIEHLQDGPLPITASVKRDIKKEGYLYKQGGKNRNKGWKQRWLEFDGKRLRYYLKKGCAQSLRIIPVQLMVSAEHSHTDSRPPSRTSSASLLSISSPAREFQFTLKCKNRTFLFGTNDSDNCQLWLNCLMAAIIEKDRMNSGNTTIEEYGGEMANPLIKGHIKFDGKRNPYYVALKGSKLCYYYTLEDYRHNSAISELNMDRAKPQDLEKTKLQLLTAQHTFTLQFENSVERDKWMVELKRSHERCIKGDNMAILETARQTEGNEECADCGSKQGTEWASINLGIVICDKCAGAHRSLGVDISKTQSLMMDSIFERNERVLELLHVIGNRNSNEFWLKTAPEAGMINQDSFMQIRIKHIREKYAEHKFIDNQYTGRDQDALNDAFIAAIRDGDILKTMALLKSGAQISYKSPEDNGQDAFEIATASQNLLLLEYLTQNKTRVITNGHSSPAPQEPPIQTFVGGDQKNTSIYLDGYMEKTNEHLTGYKKRWFVLHYGSITYFADKLNNQKGTFDLTHALSISLAECEGRKFCFDLSHRANKERTYRFSAPNEESRQKWFNTILQVIAPQVFVCADDIRAAGMFYVKQDNWKHVWLIITDNRLHVYDINTAEEQYTIVLELGVECYKHQTGKGCKFADPHRMESKVLDGNQSVAIQSGDKLTLVQGMILQDTKKVYSLVEKALRKCYGI